MLTSCVNIQYSVIHIFHSVSLVSDYREPLITQGVIITSFYFVILRITDTCGGDVAEMIQPLFELVRNFFFSNDEEEIFRKNVRNDSVQRDKEKTEYPKCIAIIQEITMVKNTARAVPAESIVSRSKLPITGQRYYLHCLIAG